MWSFPEDDISIEFGMKDGVLSYVRFRYRKGSEEDVVMSFSIKLTRTLKELCESVRDLMVLYPVLD